MTPLILAVFAIEVAVESKRDTINLADTWLTKDEIIILCRYFNTSENFFIWLKSENGNEVHIRVETMWYDFKSCFVPRSQWVMETPSNPELFDACYFDINGKPHSFDEAVAAHKAQQADA